MDVEVNSKRPTIPHPGPGERRFGRINWLGVRTLYMREVTRFVRSYIQTVFGPVVTTLLFLAVFAVAISKIRPEVAGVPFIEFLAPGLVMMAIVQNAFAHASSSVMFSKVQGNIVDLLMPPLSAGEVTFALVMGGVTRGIAVAVIVTVVMLPFVDLSFSHLWAVLFFSTGAAVLLSVLGTITGIWAEKIDHMATITNFVVMPLSFLSGTFYSIERLPEAVRVASQFNPLFYVIDGLRYGFIDHADSNIGVGVGVVTGLSALLWAGCYVMIARGYKLKA